MYDILKARDIALKYHEDQKYGNFPYIKHLHDVANIVFPYGAGAIILAYLHDTIEDTDLELKDIEREFGDFIAKCVNILTDEPGENRKTRKLKTYKKMELVSGPFSLALIVKAADRLANLRACVTDKKTSLLEMYKKEHNSFRQAVYRPRLCEPLWIEIQGIINNHIACRLPVEEVWRYGHNTLGHAPHCCATGCGDKIKPGVDDCAIMILADNEIWYLEDNCIDWFEKGHPDYGFPKGKLMFVEKEDFLKMIRGGNLLNEG